MHQITFFFNKSKLKNGKEERWKIFQYHAIIDPTQTTYNSMESILTLNGDPSIILRNHNILEFMFKHYCL